MHFKNKLFTRIISLFIAITFLTSSIYPGYARAELILPVPIQPPLLRYLSINSANPYNYFNFLLDKGSDNVIARSEVTKQSHLSSETKKLINYFFLGITLKPDAFWVNLQPKDADRMTSEELARTDMGKVLLEQDLQLKKDVAKFLHPDNPKGKKFWEALYTNIGKDNVRRKQITTSQRVWIVPDHAVVVETYDGAFIKEAKLKVMMESEYLQGAASLRGQSPKQSQNVIASPSARNDSVAALSESLMKQIIIPEIVSEVNNSASYAPLRQIYYSLILAEYFKQRVIARSPSTSLRTTKQSHEEAAYESLINSGTTQGLESSLPWSKQEFWQEYIDSYQKGEYKVKRSLLGLARMYFSGGITLDVSSPMVTDMNVAEGILEIIPVGMPANIEPSDNLMAMPTEGEGFNIKPTFLEREPENSELAVAASPMVDKVDKEVLGIIRYYMRVNGYEENVENQEEKKPEEKKLHDDLDLDSLDISELLSLIEEIYENRYGVKIDLESDAGGVYASDSKIQDLINIVKNRVKESISSKEEILYIESPVVPSNDDDGRASFIVGYYVDGKRVDVPDLIIQSAQNELERVKKEIRSIEGSVYEKEGGLYIEIKYWQNLEFADSQGKRIIRECREQLRNHAAKGAASLAVSHGGEAEKSARVAKLEAEIKKYEDELSWLHYRKSTLDGSQVNPDPRIVLLDNIAFGKEGWISPEEIENRIKRYTSEIAELKKQIRDISGAASPMTREEAYKVTSTMLEVFFNYGKSNTRHKKIKLSIDVIKNFPFLIIKRVDVRGNDSWLLLAEGAIDFREVFHDFWPEVSDIDSAPGKSLYTYKYNDLNEFYENLLKLLTQLDMELVVDLTQDPTKEAEAIKSIIDGKIPESGAASPVSELIKMLYSHVPGDSIEKIAGMGERIIPDFIREFEELKKDYHAREAFAHNVMRVLSLMKIERKESIDNIFSIINDSGHHFFYRAKMLEALGNICKNNPDIAQKFIVESLITTAKKAERGDIRREALRALGKIKTPEAIPVLIEALEDGDDDVRMFAARILGDMGVKEAVGDLKITLTYDVVPKVRTGVAYALGLLGDIADEGLMSLLKDKMSNDPDFYVKEVAREAIVSIRKRSAASSAVSHGGEAEKSARVAELEAEIKKYEDELSWLHYRKSTLDGSQVNPDPRIVLLDNIAFGKEGWISPEEIENRIKRYTSEIAELKKQIGDISGAASPISTKEVVVIVKKIDKSTYDPEFYFEFHTWSIIQTVLDELLLRNPSLKTVRAAREIISKDINDVFRKDEEKAGRNLDREYWSVPNDLNAQLTILDYAIKTKETSLAEFRKSLAVIEEKLVKELTDLDKVIADAVPLGVWEDIDAAVKSQNSIGSQLLSLDLIKDKLSMLEEGQVFDVEDIRSIISIMGESDDALFKKEIEDILFLGSDAEMLSKEKGRVSITVDFMLNRVLARLKKGVKIFGKTYPEEAGVVEEFRQPQSLTGDQPDKKDPSASSSISPGGIDINPETIKLELEQLMQLSAEAQGATIAKIKTLLCVDALLNKKWSSLSELYFRELMLDVKYGIVTDIEDKDKLLAAGNQLKAMGYLADSQGIEFLNTLEAGI